MRLKDSLPETTVQRYTIEANFHKIGAEPITFGTVFILSVDSVAWTVRSHEGSGFGGRVGLRGAEF